MWKLIHLDYTVDLGHKPEAGEETNGAWKQQRQRKKKEKKISHNQHCCNRHCPNPNLFI